MGIRFSYVWTAFVVLTLLLVPAVGEAGSKTTKRDLSDFLDAQGTRNDPPQFFPDVQDYLGWADSTFTTFALIDYAGLADGYIEAETDDSLGTSFKGKVREKKLSDGTAKITVKLRTCKALAFAQSIQAIIDNGFDFVGTPTLFGVKAQDIVGDGDDDDDIDDDDIALGWSMLKITFVISEPGADLPDLLDVFDFPGNYSSTLVTTKFSFESKTYGETAAGDDAVLYVFQDGKTVKAADGTWSWSYDKEIVTLTELDDDDDDDDDDDEDDDD